MILLQARNSRRSIKIVLDVGILKIETVGAPVGHIPDRCVIQSPRVLTAAGTEKQGAGG